jgi:hypothetical protein
LNTAAESWLGLVLYDDPRPCTTCHRPIPESTMAVADPDGSPYHFRCAYRLGWVPSDTEAWTLALYSTASEAPQ